MKAMLLAAGRGERMGVLTEKLPKPLLPVAGKPLIAYHLEALARAGFSEVVINLGYRGEQISACLGCGEQFGLSISYSQEPQRALESGGGIFQALSLLGNEPFIVINADIWTDYPFQRLREQHLCGVGHLVLVANPDHVPEGDFGVNADKRLQNEGGRRLTFSGISLLRAELFSGQKPGRFSVVPLLRRACAEGRLSAECYRGQWIDVGTPARLHSVRSILG